MADEQSKTLEALQISIQMELDGKAFYLQASRNSGNPTGRELFYTLANEEDLHRQKFEEIFQSIREKRGWPEPEPPAGHGLLETVFSRASRDTKSTATELEAVQTAMEMENRTYDFYQGQSLKAAYDGERKFYELLAGQERAHHAVLLDYYEFLKNPEHYFTLKERHSLDGG